MVFEAEGNGLVKDLWFSNPDLKPTTDAFQNYKSTLIYPSGRNYVFSTYREAVTTDAQRDKELVCG